MTAEIGDHSKTCFLIIDDEPFVITLIEMILESMGAGSIQCATNGVEGLQSIKIATQPPDIVICDLNMPGMDGIEFLRHLGELGFNGGIILQSGEDKNVLETVQTLAQAHSLHVLGALKKPLKRESLEALIVAAGEKPSNGGRETREYEITADDLRHALDEEALHLNFQPKVAVADKQLYGVEALARWVHPTKGYIPPDFFVHMAEEHGLIDDLTDAVCRMALSHAGEWAFKGLNIKIAINISIDNLANLEFPEWLVALAVENGVNPSNLILEVTETKIMQDITKPLEILARLRLKGVGLSIDDFGTGASSLEQLQRIPFTELKIDRAFVHQAGSKGNVRAMLETSAELAKKLDLKIVAEGVEDDEDWAAVERAGCQFVQGYFIARPMAGDDFFAWQKGWPPDE